MNEKGSLPILNSSLQSPSENTHLEILTALTQALVREISALHSVKIDLRAGIDLAREIESYEANLIRNALMQSGGRQSHAAELLKVKKTTLCEKIKRYKILEKTQLVF